MNSLLKVLSGQTFLENLLLLLITALLTGLLVPLVKAQMDDKKYRQQKQFEAQLARQSKVIESQVTLLENLSQLLWEFHFSCLEVSYYAQNASYKKRYNEAMKEYDRKSWVLMTKIGTEIGKAQRLVSDGAYAKLKDFYDRWMIDVDNKISALNHRKASPEEWRIHHYSVFREGDKKIDEVLGLLARELRLEAPQPSTKVNSASGQIKEAVNQR